VELISIQNINYNGCSTSEARVNNEYAVDDKIKEQGSKAFIIKESFS